MTTWSQCLKAPEVKLNRPSLRVQLAALLLVGIAALTLSACRPSASASKDLPTYEKMGEAAATVYVLAVHPLHNPKKLFEVYQPLVDYLNAHLKGARLKLEASANYAAFESKLAHREVDFALPNPYQTLLGISHGYKVFAKMGDDENFRGVILVRKDSGIVRPEQLIGKAVSYPAPTALAAAVLPQWFLVNHGVNVMRDVDNRYVGTQESSIMNVALGKVAAGATWPAPWNVFRREQPELAAQLEVRWLTPHLVNNSLLARDDMPPDLVLAVRRQMVALHESAEGRVILDRLSLSRFDAADDDVYKPVADFVQRFEAQVRPVNPDKGK